MEDRMINEIKQDADQRMDKSIIALRTALNKIRTGRAHPGILEAIIVPYYGVSTPLNQLANITVEDNRTLAITPWERSLVPEIERAIMKSDLGLNPSTTGNLIRVPMPALTEETRKGYIRQARQEAENTRISVRNIRRDANGEIKTLLREKSVTEDDSRRAEEAIQKLTDSQITVIDTALVAKEKDLLEI
jgi:ribosome recycling factor